jgi:hypothetical protein
MEQDAAPTEKGFTPPYISFQTVANKLAEWTPDELPARLDRTVLHGMAGGTQTAFLSSLRDLGFVDAEHHPTDLLKRWVEADDEGRRQLMQSVLASAYPEAIAISDRKGTTGQLEELFRERYGVSGSTMRKAVTFFMHAARFAELDLSPNFKPVRTRSGSPPTRRRTRSRAAPAGDSGSAAGNGRTEGVAGQPRRTVTLRSGGTLTVAYTVDLFDLSADDREFVLSMIDMIKNYEAERPAAASGGDED